MPIFTITLLPYLTEVIGFLLLSSYGSTYLFQALLWNIKDCMPVSLKLFKYIYGVANALKTVIQYFLTCLIITLSRLRYSDKLTLSYLNGIFKFISELEMNCFFLVYSG